MNGSEQTVWVVGLNTPFQVTLVFEDRETAREYIESTDYRLEAEEIEFVPPGGDPTWFNPDGSIQNYEDSRYDELRRKAQDQDTDSGREEGS